MAKHRLGTDRNKASATKVRSRFYGRALGTAAALSLALSACSFAPKYRQPDMTIPGGWSNAAGVGLAAQPSDTPFWQEFGSADLNRLIEVALEENRDLEAALHRVEQARAQAKVAAAPLYPTVTASGSGSQTFQDPKNAQSLRAGGSLNYEIDLWGKNRNQASSANFRVDALSRRPDRELCRKARQHRQDRPGARA